VEFLPSGPRGPRARYQVALRKPPRDPSHQMFPSGKSHRLNHTASAVDAAQFELGSEERVLLVTKRGRGKGRAASRKIPAFHEKPSARESQKL